VRQREGIASDGDLRFAGSGHRKHLARPGFVMDWRTRLAASYSSAVDPAASKRLHMMALRSLVDFAEYSVLGRALLVANRTTWPISRTARQHARWILRRRQLFAD